MGVQIPPLPFTLIIKSSQWSHYTLKQNYKLRGNSKVYILPISDLHIGSPEFNEDYFQHCLDTIDNIQQDKRIYLCGDLLEAASKSVGNSAYQSTLPVEEQIDLAISYLKPYRKDIVYSCMGNHEARLQKEFNLDVNHIISKALRCPNGNQTIDTFFINQKPVTVYAAHGKGSSAHFYTAESKFLRETQHLEADIFLNGHNHRCGYFTTPIRSKDGIKRRHYVFTGAFLRYGGYANQMQLPILPEAFIQLNINKEHRIRSNSFYIDENRPDLFKM